jgi:uncharacterized membrane protein
MTYDSLKIIHIVSASLLLSVLGYSYHLWRNTRTLRDSAVRFARIQTLTWLLILPLALMQLASGGMMISMKHEDLSQTWISASLTGFVLLIVAWFSFIYFLLLSQQMASQAPGSKLSNTSQPSYRGLTAVSRPQPSHPKRIFHPFRRAQSCMLILTAFAVLLMVFFMSSKVA